MVTVGQRRLGRKIRKLENSVEFSPAECKAKVAEKKYVEKVKKDERTNDDSPIQNLQELAKQKRKE